MRKILRMFFVVALAAVAAAACSKDDKDGSVAYAQKALFLNYGESATIGFSGVNISSYSVSSVPTGWKTPEINTTTMTMTVTAPEADAEAKTTGSIVLRGVTHGGEAVSASLFVSLTTPEIDLSDAPANCYIANRPNALYLFDATCKGDGSPIATKRVAVIWQTSMNLIRYLNLEKDGKASFFVEADDDDETIVERGNALIGGYDADGNLLWSWHIWITDFDPEADALSYGDYRVMSRQLGALQNGNADKDEIWNSYGLYYQWGRKDPFAGPTDWNDAVRRRKQYGASLDGCAGCRNGNIRLCECAPDALHHHRDERCRRAVAARRRSRERLVEPMGGRERSLPQRLAGGSCSRFRGAADRRRSGGRGGGLRK